MKIKKSRCLIGFLLLILMIVCLKRMFPGIWPFERKSNEKLNRDQKEITILLPYVYLPVESYEFLERYRVQYERKTGVKIKYERILAGDYDRYILKRNSILYMKQGPTLILIPYHEYCRDLVEKGVALEIRGKVENQEKIYNGLKDDYYIPVKIHGKTVSINRELLEKLNIEEPKVNWTKEDHDYLWEQWVLSEDVYFNRNLFFDILDMKISDLKFFDPDSGSVHLNNEKVIERIEEIREEVFSGKYILNENYSYENYYRIFHDFYSEESKDSWEKFIINSRWNFIMNTIGHHYNGLHCLRSERVFRYIPTSRLLPDVRGNLFHSIGFIVNRNGKNIELGLNFLNYLLSDEIQLDIYIRESEIENSTNAPVNKEIQKEIERIERENGISEGALEIKKYMENILEEEDCRHIFYGPTRENLIIQRNLITEIIEIVFADEPYSKDEISRILKRLEDKLFIYIHE